MKAELIKFTNLALTDTEFAFLRVSQGKIFKYRAAHIKSNTNSRYEHAETDIGNCPPPLSPAKVMNQQYMLFAGKTCLMFNIISQVNFFPVVRKALRCVHANIRGSKNTTIFILVEKCRQAGSESFNNDTRRFVEESPTRSLSKSSTRLRSKIGLRQIVIEQPNDKNHDQFISFNGRSEGWCHVIRTSPDGPGDLPPSYTIGTGSISCG